MSITAAMGMPKLETGPQKSAEDGLVSRIEEGDEHGSGVPTHELSRHSLGLVVIGSWH